MNEEKRQAAPPQSIRKNVALSTFYQILCIITPIITTPYITRVLGRGGVGIYSYTSANVMFFSLFAGLGTASYGTREIARCRDYPEERSRTFWEIELLTVCTSLASLLAYGVFLALAKEDRVYYAVLSLMIINTMMDIHWFFGGMEQFQYLVRQNTIFRLLGVVLLFVLVRKKEDLLIYIALMTVTNFLATLSMWLYLPRFLVKIDRKQLRIRRHFKETLIYFIPTIATSIYTVLDKTLIQAITHDTYQNAYYEEATKLVNVVKAVTFTSLNTVLGSRIAYLFKEERFEEIRERIADSINYIFFIGIGAAVGLVAVSVRFIPWYLGEEFRETVPVLILLSPVVIIVGISNCLGSQFFTPGGYRRESARYIIAGSCVNFCMNMIFIPHLGSIGAVIGTLVAETTITALYVRHDRGYLTVGQMLYYSWKKLIAAGCMFALIFMINRFVKSEFLSVILDIAAGGITYLLVLALLRDSFIERILFGKILHKRKRV